jgi:hypothetical protein
VRHPSSLYRVGGISTLAGSALMIVAMVLRPPTPELLSSAAPLSTGNWVISFGCLAMGMFLLLGGWLSLSQHFEETQVEGWGAVGLAGFILGSAGMLVTAGLNIDLLPTFLELAASGTQAEQNASLQYLALSRATHALEVISWPVLWTGIALSSVAIAEDDEYPRWLGYSGILVSFGEIATLLLSMESLAHDSLSILGFVWLGVVGFIFLRIEKEGIAGSA